MEPIQYNPTQSNTGFDPIAPVDFTSALATEHEKALANERAVLNQIRADSAAINANNQQRIAGIKALAEFSTKAADELSQLYVDDAIRQRKDAFTQELLNPTLPSPDYVAGTEQAAAEYIDGQKVATEIGKVDYEAATPFRSGSVWAQMGRKEAQALKAIETQLPNVIREATKQFSTLPPAERDEYINNEVIPAFAERYGMTGMRSSFLQEKILPEVRRIAKYDSQSYRSNWIQQDSARREEEIFRDVEAGKPLSQVIPALSALADQNGFSIGPKGAWEKFDQMIISARRNGYVTDRGLEVLKSEVIPKGSPGEGKTYGEFYARRFKAIDRSVRQNARTDWKNQQDDRQMVFEQEEQAIVDAYLDPEDTDGFTDDQIQERIDYLFDKYGIRSSKLTTLKQNSVEGKRFTAQKQQAEDLLSLGLLTTERLMKFDPRIQKDFMSRAQAVDKLQSSGGLNKAKEAIKDAVEFRADVTPMSKKHPTVGLKTAQMQEKFMDLVFKAETSGSQNPVGDALNIVIREISDPKVTVFNKGTGFEGVLGSDADRLSALKKIDSEISRVDAVMKDQQGAIFTKEGAELLFSRDQLEAFGEGYGQPGWKPNAMIEYIASKQGVDPMTVLNKLREINGLDALPPSPAIEQVQNELTPKQQQLLYKFKTPERSSRGLSNMSSYAPERVPQGYGEIIQRAGEKFDIPPAIIAGLIETESAWNVQAYNQYSKAEGLTQFIPSTAAERGVDVTDPESAIMGAASYLRDIMDGKNVAYPRQVSLEMALYMYNAGPNYKNLATYPLPGENAAYLPKVLKAAAKYGYGKEVLKNQAILRPGVKGLPEN
jgi:hypothetical protein